MVIKEVNPITKVIPNNVKNDTPKPKPEQTPYKFAGKESLFQSIKKSIPKQLIPTKRIEPIFGAIFLLVIIIAAFQFPLSSLLSGNIDITIKIGYPLTFLELVLTESEESPLKILNLIIDLFIYLIVAYIIDVTINLILQNPLLQSKKDIKQKPIVFKDRKLSIAEKATEKIAEKQKLK